MRSFGYFHWKIAGTNGNSEKVVVFFRKFVFYLHFSLFTYFVLVLGLLALSAVPRVKRCASIGKFWVNVKSPVTFFPNGNS